MNEAFLVMGRHHAKRQEVVGMGTLNNRGPQFGDWSCRRRSGGNV